LGGGLALIAGAQSRVSAVGISGVNAKLSRDSFYGRHAKPFPVTVEDLDTYTFNVVPKGDPVPMLDDKASLYQNINCTAGANDLLGCHSVVRTICETMYRCGTKFSDMDKYRPVLCECVLQYEYPEPNPLSPNGTATSFRQKCIDTYPNKWNRSAA
jgi:lipase ATG15